jgi:hypothetical protein
LSGQWPARQGFSRLPQGLRTTSRRLLGQATDRGALKEQVADI